MLPISAGGLLGLLVALLPLCAAQFNTECGVGEVPLKMKIGGTDKLTKCTDFFDDVDPYAIATVGSDRLGVSKVTGRLDNTAVPKWDALLDFGCVEKDSRISFRVKDFDYLGDESCLGPLSLLSWPPSGLPALVCEQEVINGVGTGCLSFALFYGSDAAEAASSGLEIPPIPGTSPTASSDTSPFMTPTTPDTTPTVEAPGVPPSEPASPNTIPDVPTVTPPTATRTRNGTRPATAEPEPMPQPQVEPRVSEGPTPARSNGTAPKPKRPAAPPVVEAPAPTIEDPSQEAEKAKSARRTKGAAVAGGLITTLALVGAAVGIYASRRRRRQQGHAQGIDLEDPNSGRTMRDTPGSVAVL